MLWPLLYLHIAGWSGLSSHTANAHNGVHSSIDLHFSSPLAQWPIVTSNWGFFRHDGMGWRWLCPEAVNTLDLYTLAVTPNEDWWIGTLDGIWSSRDQCSFSTANFTGKFVSQIERKDAQMWISTASGFAENGLWLSEDNGLSFVKQADFGLDSRIYAFTFAHEAVWVVGERDDVFFVARQYDEQWQDVSLSALDGLWVELLAADPWSQEHLWVSMTAEHSTLWKIDINGDHEAVLQAEKKIVGMGYFRDWLIIGGESGFYASADAGQTWQGPWLQPEVACIEEHQDYLYICSHNWQDGAAVMRTRGEGHPSQWQWEAVLTFAEVYDIMDCPTSSTTYLTCDRLWEAGVSNGGFATREKPLQDSDPDKQRKDAGCGQSNGAKSYLFFVLLGVGWSRRKNHVAKCGR